MPKSKDQQSIRSLKELHQLISKEQLAPSKTRVLSSVNRPESSPETPVKIQDDAALFQSAMRDVQPLKQRARPLKAPPDAVEPPARPTDEADGVKALTALVRDGKNFILEYTSEYIEGRGYCVPPEITRRLHQGHFAIQDYLDLHGHSVASAEKELKWFFKEALQTGKNAVLIVHGRGKSSPVKPVLKTMVQTWLRRGPFRKHLVAYASARPCDGGTGATYVLLRRQPLTKRYRKKTSK